MKILTYLLAGIVNCELEKSVKVYEEEMINAKGICYSSGL